MPQPPLESFLRAQMLLPSPVMSNESLAFAKSWLTRLPLSPASLGHTVFGFVTHFLFVLLLPMVTIGGGVQSGETNFTASIAASPL